MPWSVSPGPNRSKLPPISVSHSVLIMEHFQFGAVRRSLISLATTHGLTAGSNIRVAILQSCLIQLEGPKMRTMNSWIFGLSSGGMDALSGICTRVYVVFSD